MKCIMLWSKRSDLQRTIFQAAHQAKIRIKVALVDQTNQWAHMATCNNLQCILSLCNFYKIYGLFIHYCAMHSVSKNINNLKIGIFIITMAFKFFMFQIISQLKMGPALYFGTRSAHYLNTCFKCLILSMIFKFTK